jgi:hypothetical protein
MASIKIIDGFGCMDIIVGRPAVMFSAITSPFDQVL